MIPRPSRGAPPAPGQEPAHEDAERHGYEHVRQGVAEDEVHVHEQAVDDEASQPDAEARPVEAGVRTRPAQDEEVRQLVEKHRDWIEKSLARQREAPAASPPELTEQEMEELRRRGQEILPGRVVYWAARMDVLPTGIRITAARTRWGSCSGKNSLCFSLFLMRYPMEAIDAVVVHELAHIRHKNHGPDFYRLVEGTLPDYRQRIGLLKLPSSGS